MSMYSSKACGSPSVWAWLHVDRAWSWMVIINTVGMYGNLFVVA